MAPPIIKYAKTSDGVNIAYFAIGTGPPLIYLPPGGNAGQAWQQPEIRAWSERLASGRRLVRIDYRGMGLSDRVEGFDPERTVLDVEAVVAKEGIRHFAFLGLLQTTATAVLYSCKHPEAVSHIVLWCPYARTRDYIASSPALQAAIAAGERDWQTLFNLIGLQSAGWADAAQARRFSAYLQQGASARQFLEIPDIEISPLLSQLQAPVLVLHRRDVAFPTVEVAQRVASGAKNGRFLLFEGSALMPFFGDTEPVLAAIDAFLAEEATPLRSGGLTEREAEILALIASGSSNERIARALTISTRTVERHIGNIYLKIAAHNRAEATAYAFRHAIVPPA
jgi:pimeloyl-ACP methyl ester carboxylesterase/DNA-binding CsgD family transcriptional regulator